MEFSTDNLVFSPKGPTKPSMSLMYREREKILVIKHKNAIISIYEPAIKLQQTRTFDPTKKDPFVGDMPPYLCPTKH